MHEASEVLLRPPVPEFRKGFSREQPVSAHENHCCTPLDPTQMRQYNGRELILGTVLQQGKDQVSGTSGAEKKERGKVEIDGVAQHGKTA